MLRFLIVIVLATCAYGQQVMTNQTVLDMFRGKVPIESIKAAVSAAPSVSFEFSQTALMQLTSAGVPDDVIKAMAARTQGNQVPLTPAGVQPAPTARPVDISVPRNTSILNEYIHRGSREVGVSGTVIIPHAYPAASIGVIDTDFGYYIARHSLVGAQALVLATSAAQAYVLMGRYRYLQHTGNPRLYPFVGVSAGAAIGHSGGSITINGDRYDLSGTQSQFLTRAEAGIKYFVADHVSFETAYNLLYARVADVDFKDSSASMITFGLAFTF